MRNDKKMARKCVSCLILSIIVLCSVFMYFKTSRCRMFQVKFVKEIIVTKNNHFPEVCKVNIPRV